MIGNRLQQKAKKLDHPLIVMPFLTLLAFSLRIHSLGKRSLWYDELLELDIVQGPFAEILPKLVRHAAMPLDYYLLHSWIKLGRQDIWVRFPAFFFGILAVPLIYALGKRLFNRRVGYLAALFLTFSSFAVSYSQEVRPYALLLVAVMIAYLALWQAYQTRRMYYWVLFSLALIVAVLSHYFALFMLLPIVLFVGVNQLLHLKESRYWRHTAFFGLSVVLLIFVLVLIGRLPILYSVGQRFVVESYQVEKYRRPAVEKLNRGSGPPLDPDYIVEKIVAPLSADKLPTQLLYNAFFLVALLSLFRSQLKYRSAILLLLGWLVLPIMLIYAFLLYRGTFYAARYILYTLPAYLLLIAYGINTGVEFITNFSVKRDRKSVSDLVRLKPAPRAIDKAGLHTHRMAPTSFPNSSLGTRWGVGVIKVQSTRPGVAWRQIADMLKSSRSRSTILSGGLFLLALTPLILSEFNQLLTFYTSPPYEDWRAVAQLLQSEAKADDAIITVRAESTMNWYYPPATTPVGHYNRSQPVWEAVNHHKRRWFILSSYSFKRDKGLRDWLKQQGAVTIAIDGRVVVYFHEEGKLTAEMLARVKTFSLPQLERSYKGLADQFKLNGDIETSQAFYEKAAELAKDSFQETDDEDRLITLIAALFGN